MMTPDAPRSPANAAHRGWLAASFVLAFFAVGVMLWPLRYADVEIPTSLIGPGLLVVLAAAVLARVRGRAGFWITTLVVGLGAPAAIAARVAVETATDPTSHNLWPFELFFGGVVGHACAAVGALIAWPWARKSGRS